MQNQNTEEDSYFPVNDQRGLQFHVDCIDPKKQFQDKIKAKAKERKELLEKLLGRKPERFLLDCDEETLKKHIGEHRILPKPLRIDFILERAIIRRKKGGKEASLFDLFEKEFINKKGDIYDYLYDDFTIDSSYHIPGDSIKEGEKEGYSSISSYFVNTRKIAILKAVKKIWKEKENENFRGKSSTDFSVETSSEEIGQPLTVARVCGSPSFGRFRQKILHDMHVKRRPLSWFRRRVQFFHHRRTKDINQDYIVESPSGSVGNAREHVEGKPKELEDREKQMHEIMRRAVKQLFTIQRSRYENFISHDDVLLEKLVMVMRQVSRSMKKINESKFKSALEPSAETSSCDDKIEDAEKDSTVSDGPSNHVTSSYKEAAALAKEIRAEVWKLVLEMLRSAEINHSEEELFSENARRLNRIMEMVNIKNNASVQDEVLHWFSEAVQLISLNRKESSTKISDVMFGEITESCRNLMKEVQEMIIGPLPAIHIEQKPENKVRKEQIYLSLLGWSDSSDTSELKVHIKKGIERELSKPDFDTVWKDSILTGLFFLNKEVQLLEEGRIIVRPQKEKRVKIMSGGKVGMEPLYAEYVAEGMLDCVVLGNKNRGPSSRFILQAIMSIASDEGVYIIIMNEFEYLFNFFLAVNQAKKLGINCLIVTSEDDITHYSGWEKFGRQTSLGIIAMFKVAAALASEGHTLEGIHRIVKFVYSSSVTCYISETYSYLNVGFSGINEGKKIHSTDIKFIARKMMGDLMSIDIISANIPEPGTGVVLFLNHQEMLGEEISMIVKDTADYLQTLDVKLKRIYLGGFIPLFGKGFTLTMTKDYDDFLLKYLDAPTSCHLWPSFSSSSDYYATKIHKSPITSHPVVHMTKRNAEALFDTFQGFIDSSIVFASLKTTPKKFAMELNAFVAALQVKRKVIIRSSHLQHVLVEFGEEAAKMKIFELKLLSVLCFSASQEFLDEKSTLNWRTYANGFYRGAYFLKGYTRNLPEVGSIVDLLFQLARSIYDTEFPGDPITEMKRKLESMKGRIPTENNIGIQFYLHIFNDLIDIFEDIATTSMVPVGIFTEETSTKLTLCEDPMCFRHNYCKELTH